MNIDCSGSAEVLTSMAFVEFFAWAAFILVVYAHLRIDRSEAGRP